MFIAVLVKILKEVICVDSNVSWSNKNPKPKDMNYRDYSSCDVANGR